MLFLLPALVFAALPQQQDVRVNGQVETRIVGSVDTQITNPITIKLAESELGLQVSGTGIGTVAATHVKLWVNLAIPVRSRNSEPDIQTKEQYLREIRQQFGVQAQEIYPNPDAPAPYNYFTTLDLPLEGLTKRVEGLPTEKMALASAMFYRLTIKKSTTPGYDTLVRSACQAAMAEAKLWGDACGVGLQLVSIRPSALESETVVRSAKGSTPLDLTPPEVPARIQVSLRYTLSSPKTR